MDGLQGQRSGGRHAAWRHAAFIGMVAAGLCGPAAAADGTFQVRAYVLPSRAADTATVRARVPAPSGARLLTRNLRADSYAYGDAPERAARHYREAMRRNGFRLVAGGGDAQVWEDATHRIEIRLRQVLGAPAMTRIVVIVAQ